jgi:hypothetical protein
VREAASDQVSRKESNMDTILKFLARTSLILMALGLAESLPVTLAMTQILPDAQIEGDEQSIHELTSTFDRAQEAIRSRDLDALMSLYAQDYQYPEESRHS